MLETKSHLWLSAFQYDPLIIRPRRNLRRDLAFVFEHLIQHLRQVRCAGAAFLCVHARRLRQLIRKVKRSQHGYTQRVYCAAVRGYGIAEGAGRDLIPGLGS